MKVLWKRIAKSMGIVALSAVMLTACSAASAPTDEKIAAASVTEVTTESAKDVTSDSKNEMQNEAENETDVAKNQLPDTSDETHKLILYSAGPGGLAENIVEGFKAKTGIEVELYQATTGKILARLEAEKANSIADVVILASWPSAADLKAQGLTQAYTPENADKIVDGWRDSEDHYVGYSGSALGITYNTLMVKPSDLPSDWDDFTQPEWQDVVNIPDPTSSGSAMDFISGYINNYGDEGWTLFESLKGNGLELAGANKEALAPVISGAKNAVLAGVDYMAYSSKAKGEPVDIIYPKSGTVVNPRPAMILNEAHNLKNAKLFMDYLLSDEAQGMVVKAYILPGRTDIEVTNRAALDEIPLLNYDWNWMTEHTEEINQQFMSIYQ
ncbi:MAG: iron(III) transport system substrate-binding protein [Clostridiales bacterium]|jgi:iron(III) transport system substrate-binding protein|nr:iron(III) transport system substrate-binding protein [Clostridiales bacterium]MDN5298381.1 iron(III) transport system substrate-binding protein [Clostridiales bacterium]